ncbi:hypothetical protein HMPREF9372_1295, partial [Sporosarcina newyorkensis 2681]
MKKALKVTLGAALAASALTPAAALAAETPAAVAKTGIYDIKTGDFVSKTEFKNLSNADKKVWLLNSNAYLATSGTVYAASAMLLPSDQLLEAAVNQDKFQEDNNVTLTPEGTVLDKDGNVIAPAGDLKVESVSAID